MFLLAFVLLVADAPKNDLADLPSIAKVALDQCKNGECGSSKCSEGCNSCPCSEKSCSGGSCCSKSSCSGGSCCSKSSCSGGKCLTKKVFSSCKKSCFRIFRRRR